MQMVLHSGTVGVPEPPPADLPKEQKSLYDQAVGTPTSVGFNTEGPPFWYIDPSGMNGTLNANRPTSFLPNGWVITANTDRDVINDCIAYTIFHYEVAPAVLINGGTQWVAVVGYQIDQSVTPWQLKRLWVFDPKIPTKGGYGTTTVDAANWASLSYWLLNRVPATSSVTWGDTFVTVRDPRPPAEGLPAATPRHRADGGDIVSPERAVEFARQILEEEE
jgi:hypothetical protein